MKLPSLLTAWVAVVAVASSYGLEIPTPKFIDPANMDRMLRPAWAQIWRSNLLSDRTAQLIVTGTHSSDSFRAIGAPVNMDARHNAFDIKPGDKMYKRPEDRIKIW